MSKWLGYTVELFFDGQWFNIDQWHRHANGELRHRYLYTAPERDIFSSAYVELALSKERICFSDLAVETQGIICAENPAVERSSFDLWISLFGATSLTWRCCFKSLLRMKTMDTFQRIYSKGCLSGFKSKSGFSNRPSRILQLAGHRKCRSGLLSVNCDILIAIRPKM